MSAMDRMPATLGDDDALIVVDVQNDFCPGGALPVPHGDDVVPIVNRLATRFRNVVLTQDWHPRGHASFAATHPGKRPYETIAAPYGAQVLWPDHCVQGTPGAALHAGLQIPHAALIVRKGMHPAIDSYSAFYENDRKTPTRVDRIFARARLDAAVPCWPRLRFLRPLFGGGCAARRFCRVRHRRRLPRHRHRRLGGGHARELRRAWCFMPGDRRVRRRLRRRQGRLRRLGAHASTGLLRAIPKQGEWLTAKPLTAMQRIYVRRTNSLDSGAATPRNSHNGHEGQTDAARHGDRLKLAVADDAVSELRRPHGLPYPPRGFGRRRGYRVRLPQLRRRDDPHLRANEDGTDRRRGRLVSGNRHSPATSSLMSCLKPLRSRVSAVAPRSCVLGAGKQHRGRRDFRHGQIDQAVAHGGQLEMGASLRGAIALHGPLIVLFEEEWPRVAYSQRGKGHESHTVRSALSWIQSARHELWSLSKVSYFVQARPSNCALLAEWISGA